MVGDNCFTTQWERLVSNYLAFVDDETVRGKRAGYADALTRAPWIDDAILTRGVTEMADTVPGQLPSLAEFLAFCRLAKAGIEDDAERDAYDANVPLLASPEVRIVDVLDAADPYACTSDERENWARENVWLQAYAKGLSATPPPLAGPDELDSWARDWRVANWIHLTPLQRRMKERRIAGEKAAAMSHLRSRGFAPEPFMLKS